MGDVPGGAAHEVVEQQSDAQYADFQERFVVDRYPEVSTRKVVAIPPPNTKPKVVCFSAEGVELAWEFPILDGSEEAWRVITSFAIERGTYHIKETMRFQRMRSGYPMRVRRGWHIRNIPLSLQSSYVRSITHRGWRMPHGTFVVLGTHDPANPWTPYSGGGGLIRDRGGGARSTRLPITECIIRRRRP